MDVHSQLLSQLSDPNAKSKIAAFASGFIRDRLREASFAEQVIPSQPVDRSQCQVSPNHDGLVKIEFIEPRSRAMVVTVRSEPTAKFIRGEKVEIPFITIMSEMYQKPEQEFLAYNFPIADVIKENSVKDMGEVQDREFLTYVEGCVQGYQQEANGGSVTTLNPTTIANGTVVEFSVAKGEGARTAATATEAVFPVQRPDIVRGMKLLNGNRLKCAQILMTEVDANDMLSWTMEDQGSKVQGETLYNGWQSNTLLGKKLITSIKTDILRPGNMYFFTTPDFLGRFYILNSTKFYIDKVINIVKFVAWRDLGMAIINAAAVRKVELYAADATTNDGDSKLAAVSPVAESSLGLPNNRVASGLVFPSVVHF
jgi:hypothetical protein